MSASEDAIRCLICELDRGSQKKGKSTIQRNSNGQYMHYTCMMEEKCRFCGEASKKGNPVLGGGKKPTTMKHLFSCGNVCSACGEFFTRSKKTVHRDKCKEGVWEEYG